MTVYFAARDPRTPWLVRLLAISIVAYVLSPIDLIPDFIPIIGWLDDLLLVPLGLALLIRLMPDGVLASARQQADALSERPVSVVAGGCVLMIWAAMAYLLIRWIKPSWFV